MASKKEKLTDGILCVIPARYGSSRLPGKPLIMFKNLPLVMWVYNRAKQSGVFDMVCVATDDRRVHETVLNYGGASCLTSPRHASGTDRVNEVEEKYRYRYIVNLQGDEPLVPRSLMRKFAEKLATLDDNSLLTCVSHATIKEKDNPNVVKAVLNKRQEALYFSRAPIPYEREGGGKRILVHWGIYGFTARSLARFCAFPQGELERRELLEQLRALENGMRIACLVTGERSCGIDTPADAEAFRKMVEGTRPHAE
ncbi:MAG TPA: 3-deoxy-manno-octulosonate cytidylyltransferase [Chitinivibrionales bacterium]|nr:3-deoxy-manno-octulosonate cytidylyltransferase [Chitinivibrionales bacterium]